MGGDPALLQQGALSDPPDADGGRRARLRQARAICRVEAYEAAGGAVMRDLFQQDDGGWLQDAGLLDALVAEKLEREAEALRAEGWKWVEVATEFPYGHSYGLRRIPRRAPPADRGGDGQVEALRAEAERLEEEACGRRMRSRTMSISGSARSRRRSTLDQSAPARSMTPPRLHGPAYLSASTAMARLRVERGYVRPEDEPPVVDEQRHRVGG